MQKITIRTLVMLTAFLALYVWAPYVWAQDAPEDAAADDGHGHSSEPGVAYPDTPIEFSKGPETVTVMGHDRSEEHTSELQSHHDLVCRLLLEKKKKQQRRKKKKKKTSNNRA